MTGVLLALIVQASVVYHPRHLIIQIQPDRQATVQSHLQETWVGGALTQVGSQTGIEEIDALARRYGLKEVRRLLYGKITPLAHEMGLDRYYLLIFDRDIDALNLAQEFRNLASVTSADIDELKPLALAPNDPMYPDEWHLFKIQAEKGWDIHNGDSSVVVGPVDSGVDWTHPDIFPNLWVNPGEDLNGNGVFDYPDDLNNQDDDNDGYVDDIIGFDFMSNDWNPEPYEAGNDHGTHVFGIAVGATDTGIGIASVGWNLKGMAFKCGNGQYIYTSAAINAIYFAANHGAVATNHSYGGTYFNSAENNAIQYAHNLGVTATAAAGNESVQYAHYPAAYPNVIAVVATDQYDHKSDYSNYGTWVDVCAPGDAIWSTVPDSGYDAFYGTSMASPVVCGIAGLVHSLHPDWNAFQVDTAVMYGTVNIDSLNPDYAGLLGHGRVDLFYTLALTLHPYLQILEYWFDGDGRPEPGETVKMYVRLHNWDHWRNATNVTLTLSVEDPEVTVTNPTIAVGTLANGDTVAPSDYFEFEVAGSPRFALFVITYTSTPPNVVAAETLRVLLGYPGIYIVDDSGEPGFLDYYTSAFDSLGVAYEVRQTATEGVPNLQGVHTVFWFTANAEGTVLTAEEQDTLAAFLDRGGNLILSSKGLCNDNGAQSFLNQYLKVQPRSLDGTYLAMRGYDGDPIGDSVFLKLFGVGGAGNAAGSDIVDALSPADTSLYFVLPNGAGNFGPGLVRYDSGTYKALFLAFPFEAIDDETPDRTTRAQFLARMLGWMGVSVEEPAGTPVSVPMQMRLLSPVVSREVVLRYQGLEPRPVVLEVLDAAGRLVHQETWVPEGSSGLYRIPLSQGPSGVYFLRIQTTQAHPHTLRFLRIR